MLQPPNLFAKRQVALYKLFFYQNKLAGKTIVGPPEYWPNYAKRILYSESPNNYQRLNFITFLLGNGFPTRHIEPLMHFLWKSFDRAATNQIKAILSKASLGYEHFYDNAAFYDMTAREWMNLNGKPMAKYIKRNMNNMPSNQPMVVNANAPMSSSTFTTTSAPLRTLPYEIQQNLPPAIIKVRRAPKQRVFKKRIDTKAFLDRMARVRKSLKAMPEYEEAIMQSDPMAYEAVVDQEDKVVWRSPDSKAAKRLQDIEQANAAKLLRQLTEQDMIPVSKALLEDPYEVEAKRFRLNFDPDIFKQSTQPGKTQRLLEAPTQLETPTQFVGSGTYYKIGSEPKRRRIEPNYEQQRLMLAQMREDFAQRRTNLLPFVMNSRFSMNPELVNWAIGAAQYLKSKNREISPFSNPFETMDDPVPALQSQLRYIAKVNERKQAIQDILPAQSETLTDLVYSYAPHSEDVIELD